jgi:serine protease Do
MASAAVWFVTVLGAIVPATPGYQTQSGGGPEEEKTAAAIASARSCVFKLECLDRAGLGAAAVLSAVAIDEDGHVLTVGLRQPAGRKLCVRDCEGKRHEATWIGTDERTGLALLKVPVGVGRAPQIAESAPEVGSGVFVVGNPFGLNHSVSFGNISGLDRSVSLSDGVAGGLIQFTAPVYPGDSGGLLADRRGHMLGIVRTSLGEPATEDQADRRTSGIGLAIPAVEARRVAQQLRDGARVERGYLGVTGEDADSGGVRITSVADGSPARAAGIQVGDVIVAIDESTIKGFDDLASRMERLRPGTDLTLRLQRDGKELEVPVTLGQRTATAAPDQPPDWVWRLREPRWGPRTPDFVRPFRRYWPLLEPDGFLLGVETQPISQALAKSLNLPSTDGALVSDVVPGSPADEVGLRPSDVIVSFNAEPVKSQADLHERVQKAGPGAKVKCEVVREGRTEQFEVTLAAAPGGLELWRDPGMRMDWERRSRLEALERRLEELQRRVEELEKRLQARPKPERE